MIGSACKLAALHPSTFSISLFLWLPVNTIITELAMIYGALMRRCDIAAIETEEIAERPLHNCSEDPI